MLIGIGSEAKALPTWEQMVDQAEQMERRGDFPSALNLAEKAESFAMQADPNGEGVPLSLLRQAFSLQGMLRYDDALRLLERAQILTERIHGKGSKQAAFVLNQRSQAHFYAGRYSQAEDVLLEAIKLARAARDIHALSTYTSNLVQLQLNQGAYRDAARLASEALQLKLEAGNTEGMAHGERLLARALEGSGDATGAVSAARRALAIDRKQYGERDLRTAADAYLLADLMLLQGNRDAALEYASTAHATRDTLLLPTQKGYFAVADSLRQIANVYRVMNEFHRALPLYERAHDIDVSLFGPESLEAGLAKLELAEAQFEAREQERALFTARDASDLLRAHRADTLTMDRAKLLLGQILMKTNMLEYRQKGVTVLSQLAQAQADRGDLVRYGTTLQFLSAACMTTDDLTCARHATKQAVENYRKLYGEESVSLGSALATQATASYLFKDYPSATKEFRAAIATIDAARNGSDLDVPAMRAHTYIDTLWLTDHGKEEVAEAFRIAQRAQSNDTALALTQMVRRAALRDPKLATMLRRQQDLQHAVDFISKRQAEVLAESPGPAKTGKVQTLQAELQRVRGELSGLDSNVRRSVANYSALTTSSPVSLTELRGLLTHAEMLLSFNFGPHGGFVWATTREATFWHKLPLTERKLADEIRELRTGLDPARGRGVILDKAPDPALSFDALRSHRLYSMLLGPLRDKLADVEHLIIVPSGALDALPFSVLLTRAPQQQPTTYGEYREAAWLIRDHALTVLPSVASLRDLRQQAARPEPQLRRFLGMGNPDLSGFKLTADSRACPADQREQARQLSNLAALEEASEELAQVSGALGAPGKSTLLLRKQATKQALLTQDLREVEVLMFATHGIKANELPHWAEPALVLTPERGCKAESGLLTASEVAGLRLNADWVILSACNTAASNGEPTAGGLSGLARAFFYAGARALLVSHWSVDSNAATKLTTGAFEALAKRPQLTKAAALRESILSILSDTSDPRNAHPSYWAPFVVVGGVENVVQH